VTLHHRLDVTRHQLRVLDHRLHVEHTLGVRLAKAPPGPIPRSPAPNPPAPQGATVTGLPGTHTTTRASSSGAPRTHATTRASGSGAPTVHTNTRASATHDSEHETERGHDD
jgi:hypothetical protein